MERCFLWGDWSRTGRISLWYKRVGRLGELLTNVFSNSNFLSLLTVAVCSVHWFCCVLLLIACSSWLILWLTAQHGLKQMHSGNHIRLVSEKQWWRRVIEKNIAWKMFYYALLLCLVQLNNYMHSKRFFLCFFLMDMLYMNTNDSFSLFICNIFAFYVFTYKYEK